MFAVSSWPVQWEAGLPSPSGAGSRHGIPREWGSHRVQGAWVHESLREGRPPDDQNAVRGVEQLEEETKQIILYKELNFYSFFVRVISGRGTNSV